MDHGDFVVVLEPTVLIGREDLAMAPHAEGAKFRRAQRAHACGAEDVDSLAHRPEDLLVPDRSDPVEVAVDDRYGRRPIVRLSIDIALGRRRAVDGVEDLSALGRG